MDKFVGKRLDGRYEIKEIIGVGGMAVVYKAYDNQENRTVAVKILKEEFISNEEFVRRFKNESKAIAMLSHPNIVKVYDVSFGDLIQYIVMEYIDGITLKEYIEHEGSLRWKDAVHFTIQILKGLQHAHDKGIVHRDVKPQNIMVLPDGTIKVTDFGIARFARSEQRTITDKAIGSVHYISPEQARGERTDEKTDIYSVGVILYEMLTGQLPFQAENAVSVAIMQLQRELTFDYSYFVDDSPTKFVPNSFDYDSVQIPDREETEEVKEKNNMIPILAGIAVTLVVAIVILAAIFVPKLFSKSNSEIECPKFIGQAYDDIKANTEYTDNFKFETEWQSNNDYEYGYVYEQSKAEGQKVKKGATITLYISKGLSTKKVPDVYGQTESAAVSKLKAEGFKPAVEEMPSDDVEAGKVIKTDPQRTEVVGDNLDIKVYVSSGKSLKNVSVPSVVGMKQADAEKELKDKNLVASIKEKLITADDKYYPVGYVVKQEPDTGSAQIPEGSTVTIYVSSGVSLDVTVDLPSDCQASNYYVSLWENNANMTAESKKLNTSGLREYTFQGISSKQESATYTVKISTDQKDYYRVAQITVNFKTGRVTVGPEYTDYKALNDKDTSSDSSGSSGTTGGNNTNKSNTNNR